MTEEEKRRAKPIIFSTEMVEAIEKDLKTQTRRVCKELSYHDFKWGLDREPYIGDYKAFLKTETGKYEWATLKNQWLYDLQTEVDESKTYLLKPSYKVGDILWVRETFAKIDHRFGGLELGEYAYVYRASENGRTWERETEGWKWKPSIHMPKEAARIFLKVTDVRIERLQDIKIDGMMAEGCVPGEIVSRQWRNWQPGSFKQIWDIHAKRGYKWNDNPFVWVYTFDKIRIIQSG